MRLLVRLLLLCAVPVVVAQDRLGDLRDAGEGYRQVEPGFALEFPRDHGPHPDFRIEWWYLTANLKDRDGRHWGLQWTLFRQALSPNPVTEGWHSNQMWMAHAAITTPEGHFHEQRFARGGIGQAGVTHIAEQGYFNAWLDDWEWRSTAAALFPARLGFTIGEREITLQLQATGELVRNGVDGYSQKSAQGQASYYYSQPHIHVRGSITDGVQSTALEGQGWLDREWSSQPLAANQQGWDWFSLHLDDGYKLMVYQLRHDDGAHWLSGNWINPRGGASRLERAGIELELLARREIDTGDNRRREVPLEWRVALPEHDRRLRIRPLYDQQWMDTTIPYWEGVVLVEDDAGRPAGVGYMELTGYD
ncbi:MAG: lipocalin-like domain-containing protein [Gammaproteobacteria bacterium]|nr:lipocalin-like domain-containing protein [Gammaproteobacteria bacterium]